MENTKPRRNRFAEHLKALRVEAGLGQIPFAKMLGISQSTLAKYETSNREPDLDGLLAICEHLGMTPNDILGIPSTSPSTAVSAGNGALIAIGTNIKQTVNPTQQRIRRTRNENHQKDRRPH